jgi:CTP synthase
MKKKIQPKFIFVVGGVLSGVGKGITSASLGAILQAKGYKVTALKADPYINVDAGTMNPTEHGEVFVLPDGDETDQDMGNYERFLNTDLTSHNYMTTGRVYNSVISAEREMKYKGKCVQVVPHIPEEIIRRIKTAAEENNAQVAITEIGGTVGEYENILFLEAIRMLKLEQPDDVAVVLVSYLPVPSHLGEMKTKPTQHASRALNSVGLQADMIIARSKDAMDKPRREKLAAFCGVRKDMVIAAPDLDTIYEVPATLESQGVGNLILETVGLKKKPTDLSFWNDFVSRVKHPKKTVKIAVVGKYFGTGDYTLSDSYISVIEALKHAAAFHTVKAELDWVDSEEFEKSPKAVERLKQYDGIIVPGGFGTRGIEGIINTIRYAREKKIPYFGLCYGMQLATVEFVRNVVGKKDAHTVEVNPKTTNPVIHINPNQAKNVSENRYGGTMRLGSYDCTLAKGSVSLKAYGENVISERHRHRYEFNNEYRELIEAKGMRIAGVNDATNLVEIVEIKDHPFFVGVQFHPEFLSRPMRPHPLFVEFINACK